MLIEKTKINIETAEWAIEKEYFDVAINRYYYSVLQKLIYLGKKEGYIRLSETKDSHIEIYEYVMGKYKLAIEQRLKLGNFLKLKKQRRIADYEEIMAKSKTSFEQDFLYKYNMVNYTLDKLIERSDKK